MVLHVTIGVDGRASDVTLVHTDQLLFIEPAIALVRDKWRFKPANGPDGKPVPVGTQVAVVFRMPGRCAARGWKLPPSRGTLASARFC